MPNEGIEVSLEELIALRREAASLDLSPRRRVRGPGAGGYRAPFKGRGIELEEVRVYQPGDDIRSMEWRVTARTGRPHTKLFREERERPVLLWVDRGASMRFGTRVAFKSVIAARAAALVAWAAAENGDRVGGLLFDGEGHRELRPRARKAGVLPLLKALSDNGRTEQGDEGRVDTVAALARLRRVAHPGSLIVLVSDFADGLDDPAAQTHLLQLARHNDLVLAFVYDPLEAEPPPPGRYAVSDGLRRLLLDAGREPFGEAHRRRFADRREALERLCLRLGIRFIPVATHEPVPEALRRGLDVRHGLTEFRP